MSMLKLTGWVEVNGQRLTPQEIEEILQNRPDEVLRFGGEFFFAGHGCRARDHFGIMRGNCPKGTLICNDVVKGQIDPAVPDLPLEEAIITAVRLRSDQGVCALSGGVDSTLVAHLAQRECVAVGVADSHDLQQARHAAETLGLSCTYVTIKPAEIAAALPIVVKAIPVKDPVNTSIALTQYFVARFAGEQGYQRIITGQGADELFGGTRGIWRHRRLLRISSGILSGSNCRLTATRPSLRCMVPTCPCRIWMCGWCALHARSRLRRRLWGAAEGAAAAGGRTRTSRRSSPGTRRRRCSTGAGSGRCCRSLPEKMVIKCPCKIT